MLWETLLQLMIDWLRDMLLDISGRRVEELAVTAAKRIRKRNARKGNNRDGKRTRKRKVT
jgi:hypothetical protein